MQVKSLLAQCCQSIVKNLESFKKEELNSLTSDLVDLITKCVWHESSSTRKLFLKKCQTIKVWLVNRRKKNDSCLMELLSRQTLVEIKFANRVTDFSKIFSYSEGFRHVERLSLLEQQDSFVCPQKGSILSVLPSLKVLKIHVKTDEIARIFEKAHEHPSLEDLELEMPDSLDALEMVSHLLKESPHIKRLALLNGWYSPERLKVLLEGLRGNKTLEVFELKSPIFPSSCLSLIQELSKHKSLHTVRLYNMHCHNNEEANVAELLAANPNIRDVALTYVNDGEPEHGSIQAILEPFLGMKKEAEKLISIHLSSFTLNPPAIVQFFHNFLNYSSLEHLVLSYTFGEANRDIGESLAHILQSSESLRSLDISGNRLGNLKLHLLWEGRKFKGFISKLLFSDNQLSNEDCVAILECFQGNLCLEYLSFQDNLLTTEGVIRILKLLANIPALKVLDLSYNRLDNEAKRYMRLFAAGRSIDFKVDLS
ncbi:hypothetical protein PHSC3_001142 [Chlamydiales bacterium STE3]|nr:hypothetical protein PHSC3_001142 [Chlamydiales bacterium STE3]